jgi:hypothetical protein
VKPDITPQEFWATAMATGDSVTINKDGKQYILQKIVNPARLIGGLQGRRTYAPQPAGVSASVGGTSSTGAAQPMDAAGAPAVTGHTAYSIASLLLIVLAALAIVFWFKMLLDALRRDFGDGSARIAWVLVIIFGQITGALIYYFAVVYKPSKPSEDGSWWNPSLRIVLVGRRGDQRVIIWSNVIFAGLIVEVLGLFFTSLFYALITHTWSPMVVIVILPMAPAMIAGGVSRALRMPLEKLPDLDKQKVSGWRMWVILTAIIAIGYFVALAKVLRAH